MKRLLRFFGAACLLALTACASAPAVAPKVDIDTNNPYFRFMDAQKSAPTQTFNLTPFRLFEVTNGVFRESLKNAVAHDGAIRQLPPVFVQGDFHVLQPWNVETQEPIFELDTADLDPWWLDVIRMEASTIVLAREQSVKNFKEGACLDAYARTLGSLVGDGVATAAVPYMKPEAVDRESPKAAADLENWAPWKKAEQEVPPGLKIAFERTLPTGLSIKELRKLFPASEFDARERYVAALSDGSLKEFRSEETHPIAVLWEGIPAVEPPVEWKSGCNRFLYASRFFAPGTLQKCVFTGGRAYAALDWPRAYWRPVETDFNADNKISSQAAALCARLAKIHAKKWDTSQIRNLDLTLSRNREFFERLKAYAREQADQLQVGYRSLLMKK